MSEFERLVQFVRDQYPAGAFIVTPDVEIAVDGLIFRPNPSGGFVFGNENGEQVVTLDEAIQELRADLAETP